MRISNAKKILFYLIFLIGTGCGFATPGGGHDPNLPLPVAISNGTKVIVDHNKGAIVSTPDGKATLSIGPNVLSADTAFSIQPYFLNPADGPTFQAGNLYSFSPVDVPALNPGQYLQIKLSYDPSLFPAYEPRITNSSTQPWVPETDARLGLFQDNSDSTRRYWDAIFLDAPSVTSGQILHSLSTRNLTRLGIFGVTSINSYTRYCNFIYTPKNSTCQTTPP